MDPSHSISISNQEASPTNAVAFSTNVAQRIFLAQSNEFNPSTNFVIRSMLEIPVFPTV